MPDYLAYYNGAPLNFAPSNMADIPDITDAKSVYTYTRPIDWLAMPDPKDNELYLLFHIPHNASALLAFSVTCSATVTVEMGTISNGIFVKLDDIEPIVLNSGDTFDEELFAYDFGAMTDTGMHQAMIKLSGSDIYTWKPVVSSHKTAPANFAAWNIVEIKGCLPSVTAFNCGNTNISMALNKLWYVSLTKTAITEMSNMFYYCTSLISIPELDTSHALSMGSMFSNCYALRTIAKMDTSKVTVMGSMFNVCASLESLPDLDTNKVINMQRMFVNCYSLRFMPQWDTSSVINMNTMFSYCYSLMTIPELDTSKVTNMDTIFNNCIALTYVPNLDISAVTSMVTPFNNAPSLGAVKFKSKSENIAGADISVMSCSLGYEALIELFDSLPVITTNHSLNITGNPGTNELKPEDKQNVENKGWTLITE